MAKNNGTLEKYLPPGTAPIILEKLKTGGIYLRITRKRSSKLGDFRPATNTQPHRISVNHDLNPYEFLFTLLHELAHYEAFLRYGRRHKPHGQEWKSIFGQIVQPYIECKVFPPDLEQGIMRHFSYKGITDRSDHELHNLFKRYDPPSTSRNARELPTVDMLPINSLFAIHDGRQFIKLELRRKRFSCYCYNNKRMYVFGPKVPVIPLDENGKPKL